MLPGDVEGTDEIALVTLENRYHLQPCARITRPTETLQGFITSLSFLIMKTVVAIAFQDDVGDQARVG
jgi:hypothetical protein